MDTGVAIQSPLRACCLGRDMAIHGGACPGNVPWTQGCAKQHGMPRGCLGLGRGGPDPPTRAVLEQKKSPVPAFNAKSTGKNAAKNGHILVKRGRFQKKRYFSPSLDGIPTLGGGGPYFGGGIKLFFGCLFYLWGPNTDSLPQFQKCIPLFYQKKAQISPQMEDLFVKNCNIPPKMEPIPFIAFDF